MNNSCLVCGNPNLIFPIKREFLPSMQNYVYQDFTSAKDAVKGTFNLGLCHICGFAFNANFDESLLKYDQGYDNNVPSKVMEDYYRKIAKYLYGKYSLENTLVIDIGCGKGTFLKTLCKMYPNVRGLGIDPSYEDEKSFNNDNLKFIADFFSPEMIQEKPQLVVCRHVLEHIFNPISFLKSIQNCFNKYENTNFFFEVPDTEWIVENNAFWDFCYEHCNYFNSSSLSKSLKLSGFTPNLITNSYGDQYLWIESTNSLSQENVENENVLNYIQKFLDYQSKESKLISEIKERIIRKDEKIIVWGMATKGVIFSILMDSNKSLIDFCVDINENKQNCFVPITGHKISSPNIIQTIKSNLLIIIMNPNYIDEIKEVCKSMSENITYIDANGKEL